MDNSNYSFKFSIIMAIYNVEDYLNEAIGSIINQTIGFKNVQLILVDDGSSDSSYQIATDYANKYPENIIALTKSNGGQASARNFGLKYAQGKYINFLDSDDYLSRNTLNEVYTFFEKNESHIDICAIPMTLFERRNGPHRLNNKFEKGTRVIDLTKESNNPILSSSSTFIKYDSIKNFRFDENLVNLEDALIINKILLDKKTLGVVDSCEYFYRQRSALNSTVDSASKKKEYYTDRLRDFYKVLIDYCIDVEGEVPKFIQYLMAYDLQWLLKTPNLEKVFKSNGEVSSDLGSLRNDVNTFNLDDSKISDEIKEFWDYLLNILEYIGEDIIIDNENIEENLSAFFLYLKTNERHLEITEDTAILKSNEFVLDKFNIHRIWLDIVEIKNGFLNISGLFISQFNNENISIKVIKENKENGELEEFNAKFVEYNTKERKNQVYLGFTWVYLFNFDVKISLNNYENSNLRFIVTYEDNELNVDLNKSTTNIDNENSKFIGSTSFEDSLNEDNKINKSTSFEASLGLNLNLRLSDFSAFISKKPYIILYKNYKLQILPYKFKSVLRYEFSNIRKALKDKPHDYLYSIYIRILYYILYPFYINKRIWLFADRIESADDNAKHLFKYASKKKDDGIKKYFVVDKNSKSFSEMKKIDKHIIPFNSLKHKLLYLYSEKIISSFVNEPFLNPFYDKNRELYNGFETAERLFLQHGVTKDDISQFVKKYNNNLSLIVCVSDLEKESFLNKGYNYDKDIIQVLGFPRYDNLLNDVLDENKDNLSDNLKVNVGSNRSKLLGKYYKKQILFMPTWRLQLENKDLFLNSDYYKVLNSFLNNKKLFDLLDKKGYRLVFKPHAELMPYLDLFNLEENDKVYLSLEDSYQDLFKSSSILITDYSSVFFDFAYMKKPVIYYQANDDYHYGDGYFDYESMGFGEVIGEEEELLSKIEYYLENNCVMKDEFKENVDKFFKYSDDKNSKRVYEWIIEH